MMTYSETLQYLYVKTPVFQQVGQQAYKPGLDTVSALSAQLGNPHNQYTTIHVAGTNGKGTTVHTLAAILQSAGYKVGLYTSPHLKDFSERIRVNGQPVSQDFVVDFVEKTRSFIETNKPSFFEITTVMAFSYFAMMQVDVAVIEVGLGGRLDSTNIIHPCLSIITNISLDHTALLGNTLEQIAAEKAGIIKPGVPVVVGEAPESLRPIYNSKATMPVVYAQDSNDSNLPFELKGDYQKANKKTILSAVSILRKQFNISDQALRQGMTQVVELTGLQGRWQILQQQPLLICDTGHNEGAVRYLSQQLSELKCTQLHIVFGMMKDKDVRACLSLMPVKAIYYFCQAPTPRALSATDLQLTAAAFGLQGQCYHSVQQALQAAKAAAKDSDCIFVGGSNFTVAEIL